MDTGAATGGEEGGRMTAAVNCEWVSPSLTGTEAALLSRGEFVAAVKSYAIRTGVVEDVARAMLRAAIGEGEDDLPPEESPRLAPEKATHQDARDLVARFIAEVCVTGPEHRVSAGALFEAFDHWHTAQVPAEPAVTLTAFGRRLNDLGYGVSKSGNRFRHGISLRDPPRAPAPPDDTGVRAVSLFAHEVHGVFVMCNALGRDLLIDGHAPSLCLIVEPECLPGLVHAAERRPGWAVLAVHPDEYGVWGRIRWPPTKIVSVLAHNKEGDRLTEILRGSVPGRVPVRRWAKPIGGHPGDTASGIESGDP